MTLRISRSEDVAALIRDRRRELGLSQTELAERLQVSRKWVSDLERGKPTAHLDLVLGALRFLGVTLSADYAGLVSTEPAIEAKQPRPSRSPVSVKDIVDG